MRHSSIGRLVIAGMLLPALACGDGQSPDKDSGGESTSDNGDSEPRGGEDTGTESERPDTDDTEGQPDDTDDARSTDGVRDHNEPPRELPALCRVNTEILAGETVGRFPVGGDGTGQYPGVAFDLDNDRAAIVWGYIGPKGEADRRWGIQSMRFVQTVGADGTITRTDGPVVQVTDASQSPLAEQPSIAVSDDGYSVVFRDARYDAGCDAAEPDTDRCRRSLVFQALDAEAAPVTEEPILLSDGNTLNRPDIARTPDGGYMVAWSERMDAEAHVRVARVSIDGAMGDIYTVPEPADDRRGPAIAANGRTAVVVFATARQESIAGIVWPHDESAPGRTEIVADTQDRLWNPKVAAGADGFLVAYNGALIVQEEVFFVPLDADGLVDGASVRATWAYNSAKDSDIAWNGETYAFVWESDTANGVAPYPLPDGESADTVCVVDSCNEQVFAALVDSRGNVTSDAVLMSDDPNRSRRSKIVWDGVGWTMVWEAWRHLRWQVFRAQMLCDE